MYYRGSASTEKIVKGRYVTRMPICRYENRLFHRSQFVPRCVTPSSSFPSINLLYPFPTHLDNVMFLFFSSPCARPSNDLDKEREEKFSLADLTAHIILHSVLYTANVLLQKLIQRLYKYNGDALRKWESVFSCPQITDV